MYVHRGNLLYMNTNCTGSAQAPSSTKPDTTGLKHGRLACTECAGWYFTTKAGVMPKHKAQAAR